ncbi:MAG: hypothetical protein AB7H97_00130 [Pseudobdellovibrionaceae bacterium]
MTLTRSLTRKTALSIKAIAIAFSIFAAGNADAARQQLNLDYGDRIFQGNGVLHLRQEINRQYPGVNLRNADIVSVRMVAKSEMGRGTAALVVGSQMTRPERINGRPQDFHSSRPNTFDRVDLYNPSYNSVGVWQIELNGKIKIRRVVVEIDHNNGGGPGGRTWKAAGTACGPQQPWGTSLVCPNTSPDSGPIGMNCNNVPRGTKCYGAYYWNNNFACTNPNSGQTAYGSYIFNMYICD